MIHEIAVALVKFETAKSEIAKSKLQESEKAKATDILRETFRKEVLQVLDTYRNALPRPLARQPRSFEARNDTI